MEQVDQAPSSLDSILNNEFIDFQENYGPSCRLNFLPLFDPAAKTGLVKQT